MKWAEKRFFFRLSVKPYKVLLIIKVLINGSLDETHFLE